MAYDLSLLNRAIDRCRSHKSRTIAWSRSTDQRFPRSSTTLSEHIARAPQIIKNWRTTRRDAPRMHQRIARCGQRVKLTRIPRTKANLSRLVFLFRVFPNYSPLGGSGCGRRRWWWTDIHAHLNDGRRTTVTTTVIHDHVDLPSATHHLIAACA